MVTSHDQYTHRISTEIEADNRVSQRSLSRDMGIALGLTNLLVRHIVRKGWVRIIRMKSNRVRYLFTPAGITEKARMSRLALQNSIQFSTLTLAIASASVSQRCPGSFPATAMDPAIIWPLNPSFSTGLAKSQKSATSACKAQIYSSLASSTTRGGSASSTFLCTIPPCSTRRISTAAHSVDWW